MGAIELTPIGDVNRIILGVDPYTGAQLSNGERAGEVAKTVIFMGAGKGIEYALDSFKVLKSVPKVAKKIPEIVNTGQNIMDGYKKESSNGAK